MYTLCAAVLSRRAVLPDTVRQRIKALGLCIVKPTRRGYRGGANRVHSIRTRITTARQQSCYSAGVNKNNLVSLTNKRWTFPCILNLNARSLSIEKADELLAVAQNNQVDITYVSESWFNDHITDVAVPLPGFTCERKDRVKQKGGGVACYIRNTIPYKRLQILNDETHEQCGCP